MSRVLVVESDEAVCHFLQFVLSAEGHEVIRAADVLAGLDMIHECVPQVVLCDFGTSGMDGLKKIILSVRSPHPNAGIVVMNGGVALDRSAIAGVDVVLQKPFHLEELRGTVHSIAKQSDAAFPDSIVHK